MLYDAVVLVNRTTRSVSLTEAGQRHFAFCRRMLNDLSEEEDTIVGLREKPEGMLSVVAPKWISNLHVGDAVADFSITYPKIKVRFEVGHIIAAHTILSTLASTLPSRPNRSEIPA